jgi:hypothetical protein
VGGGEEVIAVHRTGGFRPPEFSELLEVADDGTFQMWRSVSMAAPLPSPIGRFAGRLPAPQLSTLSDVAKRAAAEGSRTWLVSPDSPVDRFEVDGVTATLGIHDPGDGAWESFAAMVRPLLGELTASPLAAIALDVTDGPALLHQGSGPLTLDLSHLAVRIVHWCEGESQGRWTAPETDRGEVVAGPGWRLPLPSEHGFALEAGDRLTVQATFGAFDGDRLVPVSLQTP